jgi:sugar phosphate isomerase/epimerase
MNNLARLSLNQETTRYWSLPELAAGCVAAGVGGVGLWRQQVGEYGLDETAKLMRDNGLTVTSLCRGGFFTVREPAERAAAIADNRRALDEAATLGTGVLVLVCGGMPAGDRDIAGARERVVDALAELAPYAAERGVRLAVEALHPMFCSDRCVVSTLDQALGIAERFPAEQVGVMVDAYHVWWDPQVYQQIARAGKDRILGYQVADWITPLPAGVLTGRGMIGDGCVELRRLREAVDAAGYTGPIEVEIFNEEIWARPGAEVLAQVVERFSTHVA